MEQEMNNQEECFFEKNSKTNLPLTLLPSTLDG